MKVMTILGTRPEIIRLSLIIPKLDQACEHTLVHTGQNFEKSLSDIFFEELEVRQPDVVMGVRGESFSAQIGQILEKSEEAFRKYRPDRLLILGDTNSGLSAIIARRMGIPVYHMEAGNRCYDDRVPEEINRRVIDHSSNVLLPYTENSKRNLLKEGIPEERITVTGNPINEVIRHYRKKIDASRALEDLGLRPQKYLLVTLHRAENVDLPERLRSFVSAFAQLNHQYALPVVVSCHPRTRNKMKEFGVDAGTGSAESPQCDSKGGPLDVRFLEPMGFFDFVHLELNAFCVMSDSGTVQEEACIFKVPNVTLRDVTERPETLECGSNVLTGAGPKDILAAVELVTSRKPEWIPPKEYLAEDVSSIVVAVLQR
jgi:UDP-N-acetylglucosamine 2-epimerase (non-hydrolysing)